MKLVNYTKVIGNVFILLNINVLQQPKSKDSLESEFFMMLTIY